MMRESAVDDVASIRFEASDGSGAESVLSSGTGSFLVVFNPETIVTQKIKFEGIDGTGFCDMEGATTDFVIWPSESVRLGYGKWKIYAKGYNSASVLCYANTVGQSIIVGPQGVSDNGGASWISGGNSVNITETYCYTEETKIKANTAIAVHDQAGNVVNMNTSPYNSYQVKWYLSTEESPEKLGSATTISDLTAPGTDFVEWSAPETSIDRDSYTYAICAIVAAASPSTLFGYAVLNVGSLTSGYEYTIGSDLEDYVQFGLYAFTPAMTI